MREQEAPSLPPYELRRLDESDAIPLQELHVRCAAFVELIEGHPPTGGEAAELLHARPPELAGENKLVFGLFDGRLMIGAIDLLRGYPDPATWYFGLLMLAPETRGRGLGSAVYGAVQAWAAAGGATAMRLVVQEQNPDALRFWKRHGFVEIGVAVQDLGERKNQALRLEHRFPA